MKKDIQKEKKELLNKIKEDIKKEKKF